MSDRRLLENIQLIGKILGIGIEDALKPMFQMHDQLYAQLCAVVAPSNLYSNDIRISKTH
jgi:hypothetical protein